MSRTPNLVCYIATVIIIDYIGLTNLIKHLSFIPFTGDLERGESRVRQRDNLVVTIWRDTKMVYVMLTNSSSSASTTVKCRAKDGSVADISCPENVNLYNRFMGGVDMADQLRGYYHVRMKCRKFYK